jgi:formylglycine-generating enzyme required for sulfatase activity
MSVLAPVVAAIMIVVLLVEPPAHRPADRIPTMRVFTSAMRERPDRHQARVGRHANPWRLPEDPLLGFIEIPPGAFAMGSDSRDSQAADDERPQHTVMLPAYFIGKYEVTVAQFAAFVDDAGYTPDDPDSLAGPADHPVRNVSWHDAAAYCAWLTETLRDWTGTPSALARQLRGIDGGRRWSVNLPSEPEWEKAARGINGWVYPWGNGVDGSRANYGGASGPRPVGSYPTGASPYGLLDVAGNVWEWTRSVPLDYPYRADDGRENVGASNERAVRSGSFDVDESLVRAARRGRTTGDYSAGTIGFRVVVSPFSS